MSKTKPKKTEEPKEPRWTYSSYRATLKKDGEFFALMTPDGKNALSPEREKELLAALNPTPPPERPQELSYDSMARLEGAARRHINDLEKLHWNIIPFMNSGSTREREAQTKVLQEIAKESALIESAIRELHKVYEAQFPEERRMAVPAENTKP